MTRVAMPVLALVFLAFGAPQKISVPAGSDTQQVLDGLPPGAAVELGRGLHRGPLVITQPVTLSGEPGAVVSGGESAIVVRGSDDVTIRGISVEGAQLHGIEVVDASARIKGVTVTDLVSATAQGIEVRNSDGRPDTVIEEAVVVGGQEGIVSHVSEVVVANSFVTGTTLRAIAITEMSDGRVVRNVVRDVQGVGIFCGDMSRCEIRRNEVTDVVAVDGGPRSQAGWGLLVYYHASASSHLDRLSGEGGPVAAMISSRVITRSPLEPGAGSRAIWPALRYLLILLGVAAFIWMPLRRVRISRNVPFKETGAAVGAVLVGVVVQSFHMYEHVLQEFRVNVDGVPSRGGVAGPSVEAEWVHLAYNVGIAAFLVAILLLRRAGWGASAGAAGDGFILSSVLLQGFHVVEHVAKVVQHVMTGAKVNPGLVGQYLNLVHFHFALNAVIYIMFMIGAWLYLRPLLHASARRRASRGRSEDGTGGLTQGLRRTDSPSDSLDVLVPNT